MDMGQPSTRASAPKPRTKGQSSASNPFHCRQTRRRGPSTSSGARHGTSYARGDPRSREEVQGCRWAFAEEAQRPHEDQASTLRKLKRRGGDVWRAYTLKEAFRASSPATSPRGRRGTDRPVDLPASPLPPARVSSRRAKTIRKHRDGLLAASVEHQQTGGPEGLQQRRTPDLPPRRGFPAPRQPSPWSCSPADPYHPTTPRAPQQSREDPHPCRGPNLPEFCSILIVRRCSVATELHALPRADSVAGCRGVSAVSLVRLGWPPASGGCPAFGF